MKKIAIIGAGISGLAVANLLKDYADITVFEKARGVSGRMSTRRVKPYWFDHGAQYFTARTKQFQNFIQPLLAQGIIKRWDAIYVKFKGNQIIARKNWSEEEPRYVGALGMNQVGKFLAKQLNIKINTRITALNYKDKWQLIADNGQKYSGFDWVICTAPSPQTLDLLPEYFAYYKHIKAHKVQSCFALMLGFKNKLKLEFDAAGVTDSDLSWIAAKNNENCSLVVHSSAEYASNHIDSDHNSVMQDLISETIRIIGLDVRHADYKTVHCWRYAKNYTKNQAQSILIDSEHKLAACGDWCFDGRVEAAFTAAFNLSKKIREDFL